MDRINEDELDEVRLEMGLAWRSQTDIQISLKPLPASCSSYLPRVLGDAVKYLTTTTVGIQEVRCWR